MGQVWKIGVFFTIIGMLFLLPIHAEEAAETAPVEESNTQKTDSEEEPDNVKPQSNNQEEETFRNINEMEENCRNLYDQFLQGKGSQEALAKEMSNFANMTVSPRKAERWSRMDAEGQMDSMMQQLTRAKAGQYSWPKFWGKFFNRCSEGIYE